MVNNILEYIGLALVLLYALYVLKKTYFKSSKKRDQDACSSSECHNCSGCARSRPPEHQR